MKFTTGVKMRLKGCCIALFVGLFAIKGHSSTPLSGFDSFSDHNSRTMPDGCGNPYVEYGRFASFYDAAIASVAAKRGHRAKGVTELFAVSALRSEMVALFPNYTEESPLDRIIVAQLCQYHKIRSLELKPGSSPLVIEAGDDRLADHLVGIAMQMYRDSRQLIVEALAARAKSNKEAQFLASRRDEVLKARARGREKIGDLLR